MAIFEQVSVPAQTASAANNVVRRPFGNVTFDRPRAKVWGNFGIMNGEEFIPLPLGSPIDTMEPASTTGQNATVVRLNHQKNKVLAALQELGAKMAPGETQFVANIVFQLRRVNEDLDLPKADGDLDVGDIVKLFGTPDKKAVEHAAISQAIAKDIKADIKADRAAMQAQIEALQKALAAAE